MTTKWIDVAVEIEDVLIDLEDEDLLDELRRRGVTAVKAGDRLRQISEEMSRAYKERDDVHFGVLLERMRSLAE